MLVSFTKSKQSKLCQQHLLKALEKITTDIILSEILFIACYAVICGAESWDNIELYGKSKLEWLKTFLSLPHGIPLDDTFGSAF